MFSRIEAVLQAIDRFVISVGSNEDLSEARNSLSSSIVRLRLSCKKCAGIGRRSYPNTATFMSGPGVIAGQAITEDVCDVCWGTGDSNRPGQDLRELVTVAIKYRKSLKEQGKAKDETIDGVIDLLIEEGVLQGKEIIPTEKPCHGRCCTCQECGKEHEYCVCQHNAILESLNKLKQPKKKIECFCGKEHEVPPDGKYVMPCGARWQVINGGVAMEKNPNLRES